VTCWREGTTGRARKPRAEQDLDARGRKSSGRWVTGEIPTGRDVDGTVGTGKWKRGSCFRINWLGGEKRNRKRWGPVGCHLSGARGLLSYELALSLS
jgi:hypothetical protein